MPACPSVKAAAFRPASAPVHKHQNQNKDTGGNVNSKSADTAIPEADDCPVLLQPL